MNTPILNRASTLPEDGWYGIEAAGEHVNHRARVIQVIDDTAIAAIVAQFNAESRAADFAGLRIDRDHLSQSEEHPTESLGWAMELRNRAGVLEARIDWTGLGRPLVEGKVYKFFSTEYDPADCELVTTRPIGGTPYQVVRPLRLAGLALTNEPNNKGQRPISNRRDGHFVAGDTDPELHALRITNRARELRQCIRGLSLTRSYEMAEEQFGRLSL